MYTCIGENGVYWLTAMFYVYHIYLRPVSPKKYLRLTFLIKLFTLFLASLNSFQIWGSFLDVAFFIKKSLLWISPTNSFVIHGDNGESWVAVGGMKPARHKVCEASFNFCGFLLTLNWFFSWKRSYFTFYMETRTVETTLTKQVLLGLRICKLVTSLMDRVCRPRCWFMSNKSNFVLNNFIQCCWIL